jgi:predicted PurR-regulated permease PerM
VKKSKKKEIKQNKSYDFILTFLKSFLNVVKQEKISAAGKVNFYSDVILCIFFIAILICIAFDSLYNLIHDIFAMYLNKKQYEINSNVLLWCFLVFVFFVVFCLLFMYFTSKKESQLTDISTSENADEKQD